MELKQLIQDFVSYDMGLLIVPYGIETTKCQGYIILI